MAPARPELPLAGRLLLAALAVAALAGVVRIGNTYVAEACRTLAQASDPSAEAAAARAIAASELHCAWR